jgi:hypothetical protein
MAAPGFLQRQFEASGTLLAQHREHIVAGDKFVVLDPVARPVW